MINADEIKKKINSFRKKIKKNTYEISVVQSKGLINIKKLLVNNVYS